MPRRGSYTRDFPVARASQLPPQRVGVRAVTAGDSHGALQRLVIDPSEYICRILAAELADEWVELAEAAGFGVGACGAYQRTIALFCRHVEKTVPKADRASLARAEPDVHQAVVEWLRLLPSQYASGSRSPAWHAGRLRQLIARRIEHPRRAVVGHLHGWVRGALGLRRGETCELDEFSRTDKLKLIRAAWADRLATERRISAGWALAATGADPANAGWHDPANLLWAIAQDAHSVRDIARQLPQWSEMPAALRVLVPDDVTPSIGKRAILQALIGSLFPRSLDLHSYRILLMAATGTAPEEVTGLDEDDLEYVPSGVTIDFTKDRAHARTRRAFTSTGVTPAVFLHPRRPKLDAADLTRALLTLTRPLAHRAGITPVPLFLRAAGDLSEMRISIFRPTQRMVTFQDWLTARNVTVDGEADIRRLRKSTKVEKAIAFKGRVSDIADDHTEETFRNHYAHGTTLRVISGNVIAHAQQRWLTRATTGPIILSSEAEESLTEPGAADELGLTAEEVEQLRSGQLDMGICGCKNPFDSPFGRPGQLCPVAPSRCLECRHAFVLPSNLPQLLLFAEHLERLQGRLPPQHFHVVWGQSSVNVWEAIRARTDAEIAQARRQIIDQGLTLQLPLAAHTEYDT